MPEHYNSRMDDVTCEVHGSAFKTYICEHLAANPKQKWFSDQHETNEWPDAWCTDCHEKFEREGEWNEKNEAGLRIVLFCHRCYEAHRAQAL
jgi:hypothetical protein